MVETGARVHFNESGLPNLMIDPPTTGPDDLIPWQEYFGGLTGTVIAVDPTNNVATVRGRDRSGNPYTVDIAPAHLVVDQEV